MKVCIKCKKPHELDNFFKKRSSKDGLQPWCKSCNKMLSDSYNRSLNGVITQIYNSQKLSSKKRKMNPPSYSKLEFTRWILGHDNITSIYNEWVNSDYDRWLKPSVDRIDDYKPYTIENIRLTVWKINSDKHHSDVKLGVNNKVNTPVVCLSKNMKAIGKYHSLRHASRATKIDRSSISKCCNHNVEKYSAGGFKWIYAEDYYKQFKINKKCQQSIKVSLRSTWNHKAIRSR